jgi:chromosomal replication initiator protein
VVVVNIATIQQHVAASFGVPIIEMASARRSRSVARPRQIAMFLARQLTTHSLPEIGREFGNRDHTTVMWAIERVEQLSTDDQGFAARIADLRDELLTEPENV